MTPLIPLKNGKLLVNLNGFYLYEAIDPNNTIVKNGKTLIEVNPIKKLMEALAPSNVLVKSSADEKIIAILYLDVTTFKDQKPSTSLNLRFFDPALEKIINTMKVDWSHKQDGKPTKLYFDDRNNICIEGEQKKIIYPYGDQVIECEADRKACLRAGS